MKTGIGAVLAAVAASACCLGPVALSAVGAGALGAMATRLAPYRPWFLTLTAVLLGAAFYTTYRPTGAETGCCAADGSCSPSSRRTARIILWVVTVAAVLLATFPYYLDWLL